MRALLTTLLLLAVADLCAPPARAAEREEGNGIKLALRDEGNGIKFTCGPLEREGA